MALLAHAAEGQPEVAFGEVARVAPGAPRRGGSVLDARAVRMSVKETP
jgi:hypothetical protein